MSSAAVMGTSKSAVLTGHDAKLSRFVAGVVRLLRALDLLRRIARLHEQVDVGLRLDGGLRGKLGGLLRGLKLLATRRWSSLTLRRHPLEALADDDAGSDGNDTPRR